MKKFSTLSKAIILLFILTTSFTLEKAIKTKKEKRKVTVVCSCTTPSGLTATPNGSNTILSWNLVSGAIHYSYGGYYSGGSGFSGCTDGLSAEIPTGTGGTWRVTAICEGTCSLATCSSLPSISTNF